MSMDNENKAPQDENQIVAERRAKRRPQAAAGGKGNRARPADVSVTRVEHQIDERADVRADRQKADLAEGKDPREAVRHRQ